MRAFALINRIARYRSRRRLHQDRFKAREGARGWAERDRVGGSRNMASRWTEAFGPGSPANSLERETANRCGSEAAPRRPECRFGPASGRVRLCAPRPFHSQCARRHGRAGRRKAYPESGRAAHRLDQLGDPAPRATWRGRRYRTGSSAETPIRLLLAPDWSARGSRAAGTTCSRSAPGMADAMSRRI